MFTNGRWVFDIKEVKSNIQILMKEAKSDPNWYSTALDWCACQMHGLKEEFLYQLNRLNWNPNKPPRWCADTSEIRYIISNLAERIGMTAFAFSAIVESEDITESGKNSISQIGKIWNAYRCDALVKYGIGVMGSQHCDELEFIGILYTVMTRIKDYLITVKTDVQDKMAPYWSNDFIRKGPVDIIINYLDKILWDIYRATSSYVACDRSIPRQYIVNYMRRIYDQNR